MALYTADIAENQIRGGLGAVFPLVMYSGMLIMFIMGSYINFFTISIISGIIPLIAFLLMFILPETPHFLIQRNKFDQALKSLMFYRTCYADSSIEEIKKVEDEFEMIKNGIANITADKVQCKDFSKAFNLVFNSFIFLKFKLIF